jgi:hypothetical protein
MDRTLILVNSIKEHKKHKPILLDKLDLKKDYSPPPYTQKSDDYLHYFYSEVINDTMDKIGKDLRLPYYEWTIPDLHSPEHHVSREAYLKIHEKQLLLEEEQKKLGVGQRYYIGEKPPCKWDLHYTRKRYLFFTNCYYLNSSEENFKVGVQGRNNEEIDVDVKEGDVLSIPHWMNRLSPIETLGIGFNSSYIYTGMELI